MGKSVRRNEPQRHSEHRGGEGEKGRRGEGEKGRGGDRKASFCLSLSPSPPLCSLCLCGSFSPSKVQKWVVSCKIRRSKGLRTRGGESTMRDDMPRDEVMAVLDQIVAEL